MKTASQMRVLILMLLSAGGTPFVRAAAPKIEASRSTIEKVQPKDSFRSESHFIGHYGETLRYSSNWVLHTPFLRDGIEVVRFHSPDELPDPDSPLSEIKDSDFEKVENFTPLKLAQLLVIPHQDPGFDFEAIRAKKAEELRSQGATFEFEGAPMPVSYWPKNTFEVYVTAPYRLHQLYVESEGKLFILTGGLDAEKGPDRFFSVFFADQFIGSLGQYFERLHRAPFTPPPETFRALDGYMRLVFLPLFAAGLILLTLPWKKPHTRPAATAALSASILGAGLHAGGFYLAQALSEAGRPGLIAPGVVGWILAPLILGAVYYRSRSLDRGWRWAARAFSVLAALMLVDLGMDTQSRIASGQIPVAADFSVFTALVGVLCGACFGLTIDRSRKSAGRRMLALTFLLLVARPTAATAQSLQEELEAKMTVGKRSRDGEAYKALAEDEMKAQGRHFQYQRVEITGIVAADDTNKFAPGMFDRVLHPSRNDDGSGVEREGFIPNWKRWWRGPNNARKDINDLFDTKTGVLSPRAREILEPLMGKDVHVKEVVAHSWGAVLLNVAIREGLINPPEHIIVVGVPDADLLKWELLARHTGTKVDICTSKKDLLVQGAGIVDAVHNLDILGKQKDYNDGKQHEAWARWGRTRSNRKIGEDGEIHMLPLQFEWDMSNPSGHERSYYYGTLQSEGVMQYTAAVLSQIQTRKIETRAQELMEADIQREVQRIRKRHGEIDEPPPKADDARSSPPGEPGSMIYVSGLGWVRNQMAVAPAQITPQAAVPVQAVPMQAAPRAAVIRPIAVTNFSTMLPGIRDFASASCRSPGQVPLTADITRPHSSIQFYPPADDREAARLSAGLGGCEQLLFSKLIEEIRLGNGRGITNQWVQETARSYSAPPVQNEGRRFVSPPRETPRERICITEDGIRACTKD